MIIIKQHKLLGMQQKQAWLHGTLRIFQLYSHPTANSKARNRVPAVALCRSVIWDWKERLGREDMR
jgi:hypothetical protein